MIASQQIKRLIAERQQLFKLISHHSAHPKLKLVIKELKQAISKIEDKLIPLFPAQLDQDIKDAKNAPIEYTKRKPTEFDRNQIMKIYRHRRFVCIRQQSDFHYPKTKKS